MIGQIGWKELQEQREKDSRLVNLFSWMAAIVAVAGITWMLINVTIGGTVKTVDAEDEATRVWTATLAKPAAYRMASPNADQMDSLYHLLTIQGVRRGDK